MSTLNDHFGQELRNSMHSTCLNIYRSILWKVEKHLAFSTSIIFPKDCRPILSLFHASVQQFYSKYPQWQFPKSFLMLTMVHPQWFSGVWNCGILASNSEDFQRPRCCLEIFQCCKTSDTMKLAKTQMSDLWDCFKMKHVKKVVFPNVNHSFNGIWILESLSFVSITLPFYPFSTLLPCLSCVIITS